MYEGDVEMAAKQASTYDFGEFPEDLRAKTSDNAGEVAMSMDETNRCEQRPCLEFTRFPFLNLNCWPAGGRFTTTY
jgi:hypothetical protein